MTTEEILAKLITQYGPIAGVICIAGWMFWRDFLRHKFNNILEAEAKENETKNKKEENNLNIESSMQQLLIGMGTKLIEELPLLRQAMSTLTMHILEITQGQQEHAAQLAELQAKNENHSQELKLYSNHFEKIYSKQNELIESNADGHAAIINKLDTILEKLNK